MSTQWKSDEFAYVGECSLDMLEKLVKKARAAEANGSWKDLGLEMQYADTYSESKSIYMTGQRPETDVERIQREAIEKKQKENQAAREREQYEVLKKKFEG